jgi:hypothetical protein
MNSGRSVPAKVRPPLSHMRVQRLIDLRDSRGTEGGAVKPPVRTLKQDAGKIEIVGRIEVLRWAVEISNTCIVCAFGLNIT